MNYFTVFHLEVKLKKYSKVLPDGPDHWSYWLKFMEIVITTINKMQVAIFSLIYSRPCGVQNLLNNSWFKILTLKSSILFAMINLQSVEAEVILSLGVPYIFQTLFNLYLTSMMFTCNFICIAKAIQILASLQIGHLPLMEFWKDREKALLFSFVH